MGLGSRAHCPREIRLGWVRDLAAKRQTSRESATGPAEWEVRKWR